MCTLSLLVFLLQFTETLTSDISPAVAFQFSRVGDDKGALELLQKLDDDAEVGQYVDCLPS